MISFACLGHWYAQLLFAGPSLGVIGVMGRDSMRRRLRARRGGEAPEAGTRGRARTNKP